MTPRKFNLPDAERKSSAKLTELKTSRRSAAIKVFFMASLSDKWSSLRKRLSTNFSRGPVRKRLFQLFSDRPY
jgi:hypothetical protein